MKQAKRVQSGRERSHSGPLVEKMGGPPAAEPDPRRDPRDGFYMSDFADCPEPFEPGDLDDLIRAGRIHISRSTDFWSQCPSRSRMVT